MLKKKHIVRASIALGLCLTFIQPQVYASTKRLGDYRKEVATQISGFKSLSEGKKSTILGQLRIAQSIKEVDDLLARAKAGEDTRTQVIYTIEFVEKDTNVKLAEPIRYMGLSGDKVSYTAKKIEGHTALTEAQSIVLSSTNNKITFVYSNNNVKTEDVLAKLKSGLEDATKKLKDPAFSAYSNRTAREKKVIEKQISLKIEMLTDYLKKAETGNAEALKKANDMYTSLTKALEEYKTNPIRVSEVTKDLGYVTSPSDFKNKFKVSDLIENGRPVKLIFHFKEPRRTYAEGKGGRYELYNKYVRGLFELTDEIGEIHKTTRQGFLMDYTSTDPIADYKVEVSFTFFGTYDQYKQYNVWVKDWVQKNVVDKGITEEVEKAKAIKSGIIKENSYVYKGDTTKSGFSIHTPLAMMVDNGGVCQAYAVLFRDLARAAGLDAKYVGGFAKQDSTGKFSLPHAWNVCKIGNTFYNMDITWDDVPKYTDYWNTIKVEVENWNYFLKGQDFFNRHRITNGLNEILKVDPYNTPKEDYKAPNGSWTR